MSWVTGEVITQDKFNEMFGYSPDFAELYKTNCIDISNENDTWVSNSWNEDVGTYAADATNYKTGSSGVKCSVAINLGGVHLVKTIVLSVFPDSSASTTANYARFALYIATAEINKMAADSSLRFELNDDAYSTETNYYYKDIVKASLVNGWQYVDVALSTYTEAGTPALTALNGCSIKYISTGATAPSSSMDFTIDRSIQLVRIDPSAAYANPFQRKVNGAYVRDMAINAGFWFLGLENNKVIWKLLNPTTYTTTNTVSPLVGTKAYTDFIISETFKINTAAAIVFTGWEIDASNKIYAQLDALNLYLVSCVAGTNTTISVAAVFSLNDIVTIKLKKSGSSIVAFAYKNGNMNNPYVAKGTTTLVASGYLAQLMYLGNYKTIEALSITTIEHARHADVAESLNAPHASWVPTLTWGTANPTISASTFRHQVDKTGRVRGTVKIVCSDGKAASSLTITLPTPITNRSNITVCTSQEIVNTTPSDPFAEIDDSGTTITFRAFSAMTNGQAAALKVFFDYEN
jgi:hypothetical protein